MPKLLPKNANIELVELKHPREWQKHMLVQRFEPATKSLNEFVEFYKWLDTSKEILQDKGDSTNPNKNPSIPVEATNHPCWKRTK